MQKPDRYTPFLLGFVFLVPLEIGLALLLHGEGDRWQVRAENLAIVVAVAYACERIAQWRAGVRLRWTGPGSRFTSRFLLAFALWGAFAWISIPSRPASSMFGFATHLAIFYLFAGALFEVINLIKVGARR